MVDAQTVVNLGTGGSVLNARLGSSSGADSNDPKFLDWPGDNAGNYVYLSGASGNGMSVPDDASFNVTDLDVRAYVAPDSWTAVEEDFVSRYRSLGDKRIFRFGHDTSGRFKYVWSETGSTLQAAYSSTTIPGTDGEPLWVRVTHDTDNGSGGNDITFYTSTDGTTWTQLGSTVTGGSTTSLYAGVWNMEFGVTNNTTFVPFAGKYYRAQFLDSIGGTVLVDVDCSRIPSGADTSFTALTGQTVTINRSASGRKAVAVVSPVWLFGTDDKFTVAHNALLDVGASDDFTVIAVVRQWNTPASYRDVWNKGTTAPRIWLENYSTNNAYSFYVNDGVLSNLGENTGTYTPGAVSIVGGRIDRTTQLSQAFMDGTLSSGDDVSSYGSFANTQDMLVGFDAYGIDMELLAVAVFRRALTATEIAALATYYQNKVA